MSFRSPRNLLKATVKVLCLRTLAELTQLRREIDALNLASASPDPFSTFEYYENLLLHGLTSQDGSRVSLYFLAATRSDRLIGYLALKRTESVTALGTIVSLDFLIGHDGDRPHIVAAQSERQAVTSEFLAFLDRDREWDLLEFQQQAAGSGLLPFPAQSRMRRCWISSWPTMDNYTIPIAAPDLHRYVRSLTKKFRSELGRGFRKLFAAGRLELLSSSDADCTPALLDLYLQIEPHSWKSREKLSLGNDASRLECLRGLLAPHMPMRIVIQILTLDDVPIAGLISGEFDSGARRELYALHVVFDDRLQALSPGSAILLLGIRHAINNKFAAFNWLSGFGHYKKRWLAECTPTSAAQIYRIGRLPFWKRMAGALSRRLHRSTAVSHAENSETRRVRESEENWSRNAPRAGRELKNRCDWLATAQLAHELPFDLTIEFNAAGEPSSHLHGDRRALEHA